MLIVDINLLINGILGLIFYSIGLTGNANEQVMINQQS